MDVDNDAYFEEELRRAPRALSDHLFHYTNADAALFGILASGTLRLSPFESTNDLWESRPLYPNLTSHYDDQDLDAEFGLWNEIDENIRLHAKVTCLTQDWDLPDSVLNREALRGWAYLSLWAHYGAGHKGICFRFDRVKLIDAFAAARGPDSRHFHGPVRYVSASLGVGPNGIDIGQVKEFGVDAVATAYAEANKDLVFFRKHSDWANEAEYRLVLMNQSVLPSTFNIRGALTGVFIGDAFPPGRIPALLAALEKYPDAEIHQLRFHNRHLNCFPFEIPVPPIRGEQEPPLWGTPNRSGSLGDRLKGLRKAEACATKQRDHAEAASAEHVQLIETAVLAMSVEMSSWPNTEVAVHPHITAVPESQRSRSPGVAGERVHLERGYMSAIENLPKYSITLVASAAIQVRDGGQLRIHAVVTTERWDSNGNEREERWHDIRETSLSEGQDVIASLMTDLRFAVQAAQLDFDRMRGCRE